VGCCRIGASFAKASAADGGRSLISGLLILRGFLSAFLPTLSGYTTFEMTGLDFSIHIPAIGAVHDGEEFMVFFEVFVAGFEVGPELLFGWVFAEFAVQVTEAVFGEASGEDVDGNIFLPVHIGIEAYGV
jgi:hypothetical protein